MARDEEDTADVLKVEFLFLRTNCIDLQELSIAAHTAEMLLVDGV